MREFLNSFCIDKFIKLSFYFADNDLPEFFLDAGWSIVLTTQKLMEKIRGVGFYQRDTSPARSSEYQYNRSLYYCYIITYRAIHPFIGLGLNYQKTCYDQI